jgi:hypothetical protein
LVAQAFQPVLNKYLKREGYDLRKRNTRNLEIHKYFRSMALG